MYVDVISTRPGGGGGVVYHCLYRLKCMVGISYKGYLESTSSCAMRPVHA